MNVGKYFPVPAQTRATSDSTVITTIIHLTKKPRLSTSRPCKWQKTRMEWKIAEFRGWHGNCNLWTRPGCLQKQTQKDFLARGEQKTNACRLLRFIITAACFVTTIDSFFLARGLVANFRFRQNHSLSLPQQHPSCCYGNNFPSSAVYSCTKPSSHEPGRAVSFQATDTLSQNFA